MLSPRIYGTGPGPEAICRRAALNHAPASLTSDWPGQGQAAAETRRIKDASHMATVMVTVTEAETGSAMTRIMIHIETNVSVTFSSPGPARLLSRPSPPVKQYGQSQDFFSLRVVKRGMYIAGYRYLA